MDEGTSSIWNIDGAQFYELFQLKQEFVNYFRDWKLEQAYWIVRTLRMELDAKLKRKEENKMLADMEEEKAKRKNIKVITEKEQVDSLLEDLDKERDSYLYNPTNDEAKSKFHKALEEFYMYLCHLMKKHQMFYREGDDNRLAILRR